MITHIKFMDTEGYKYNYEGFYKKSTCQMFIYKWRTITTRELQIVTERPNTELKPTLSMLKNWANRSLIFFWCRFQFGVSVEPYFLSSKKGERERDKARDRGTEGERDTKTKIERGRNGGRGREREREGDQF